MAGRMWAFQSQRSELCSLLPPLTSMAILRKPLTLSDLQFSQPYMRMIKTYLAGFLRIGNNLFKCLTHIQTAKAKSNYTLGKSI